MKLSKRIAFLFFLFLPILFFGGEAQAATINSISGTFSNNSSVTISGSEFGIKNPVAPYKYDNFQYGSDKIGQAVSVSASGGRNWNHFSSCASVGRTTPETGFRYSNAHPRYTGDISGWKFFGTNTTYDNCYQGTSYLTLNKPDGFDQVYWSMWLLSETNGQNTKVRNVKIANWNYNDTNYPQGRWDFYPAQGSGSGHVYALSCGSENSNEWGVGASAFSYGAETWNRFEGSLVVGNPGVANGRYEVYKNANLLQTTGNVMIRNSASCPKPDTFFFTHYHDDIDTSYSPPAPEQNLYHGEIYFDITRARVELCNSSTWSARAHCEIQIPHTTWNNGQIQITVNPGSFTSGQTAYLFVIDANGNASNGYPVTIGSGGTTPTCSNCCSTSQTCSTAFTTVGTCTRCCATTCQNASTDTTAPRVTAFTITPTTLTVGASLTANYTVTDNTALARAELWRAPSGTNCTDTVKTGCVWTQVISANITGTSRTGTFTSSPTAAGTFYYGLHAVDTSNNVGYESAAVRVTVNAQTPTCSNCCSTTQTCPTAFTTVGTCTRCCASTCQTTSACGNGNCETGETCSSCASDCGACPGGQCQKLSSGSAIPAGYGAPYNTLSVSGEQLMNVVCNTSSASVSIGNNSTSQYIYRYGYIWRNNAWQRIDLTGPVPAYEGNWFRGSANATVSLTATELTQENNLIAYICTWNPSTSSGQAGEWKCGCRDSACTTPYWQLQRFGNY